jgi:hypothetical protein
MKQYTALLVFLVAIAAGCGGSSSSGSSTPATAAPSSSASTSPTASASSNPAATFPCNTTTASATGTLSNVVAGTPATYPPLGSCAESITFQSGTTIASGTTVNVTTSLTAPAGAPSPLPTSPTGSGTAKTIVFETLNVTAGSIAIGTGAGTAPVQTVTLASTGSCASYYTAFAGGGAWQGFGTAGTFSGLTVTFAAGNGNGATLTSAGSPYYVLFACF